MRRRIRIKLRRAMRRRNAANNKSRRIKGGITE
jgi:hypothetical protein